MNRRWSQPLFLVASLTVAGCTPTGLPPGADVTPFNCVLGVPVADGTFVTLDDDNETELQLGFQGLAFAPVHVLASGAVPALVEATFSARVEGRSDVLGGQQAGIEMRSLEAGVWLSTDILVPVNRGSFADYVGREAAVAVRLADDLRAPTAACVSEGVVVFVDEDRCVHTGEVPICPDQDELDGGPEAGP